MSHPKFVGPSRGTTTRPCKRPELARERIPLGDFSVASSSSRNPGEPWTSRVSLRVEAGGEATMIELPAQVALKLGLELAERAVSCYLPSQGIAPCESIVEDRRGVLPVSAEDELCLIGLAARAACHRSSKTSDELAWLRAVAERSEPGAWVAVDRLASDLDPLRRAGLLEVTSYIGCKVCVTAAGRRACQGLP